jgi:hypothetical protein
LPSLARIPAPKDLMGYVQDLLWSSGELGRCLCRRGWMKPEPWALAQADDEAPHISMPAEDRITPTSDANEWLDTWIIAQSKASPRLCLVAHDPLAPPVETTAQSDAPGKWDTRGGDSYFILPKEALRPGAIQTASRLMIGDQYVLFVIEDNWPFGETRPLDSLAYSVRHVIVPITEGESYGIVSGV